MEQECVGAYITQEYRIILTQLGKVLQEILGYPASNEALDAMALGLQGRGPLLSDKQDLRDSPLLPRPRSF
jgi:hypothetical protein